MRNTMNISLLSGSHVLISKTSVSMTFLRLISDHISLLQCKQWYAFLFLLDAPPKFRRIRWNGIKTLTWTKNLVEKVKLSGMKDRACRQSTQAVNPLQVWRLMKILEHCFINCRYWHCTFACSGNNFNMFIKHVNKCRYRPIKCPNRSCLSCQPKWELEKHLETCTFSVITCPSKGCGKMVRRSQLDEHLLSCLNRNFHCPNKKLGCHKKLTFIESNDHSHSCLFVPLNCDKCGIYLQRKDLHDHAESCGKVEIQCSSCKKIIFREDQILHMDDCLMADVTCQNIGCGLTMKRYKGLQHKYVCLQRISDCPNQRNGCKFKQNKPSMERHVMSCPFRLVQCDICERMKIFKDLDDHLKLCRDKKKCENCGMTVTRYLKKMFKTLDIYDLQEIT